MEYEKSSQQPLFQVVEKVSSSKTGCVVPKELIDPI